MKNADARKRFAALDKRPLRLTMDEQLALQHAQFETNYA